MSLPDGWWQHATHTRKMREVRDRDYYAARSRAEASDRRWETAAQASLGILWGFALVAGVVVILWVVRIL